MNHHPHACTERYGCHWPSLLCTKTTTANLWTITHMLAQKDMVVTGHHFCVQRPLQLISMNHHPHACTERYGCHWPSLLCTTTTTANLWTITHMLAQKDMVVTGHHFCVKRQFWFQLQGRVVTHDRSSRLGFCGRGWRSFARQPCRPRGTRTWSWPNSTSAWWRCTSCFIFTWLLGWFVCRVWEVDLSCEN